MNLQQHLRSERALRLAGLVACGVLLFLAGLIMRPPMQENKADAATGRPTPATSSVTLSVADGPLSFNLKPTSPDGTFAESDVMTITASTDSYSGYTLSIAAQNGDNATKLINTDTTNCPVTETRCFIAPLGSIVTKNDYASPADSTAAAAVKNTWGFSPSEYLDGGTSVDNSATDGTEKYLPISTSATNLAKTTVANSSGTSDTYGMKIGARVGGDITMGTYKNTFVIAAVGNGAAYTINYADGSGQADPSSLPSAQAGTSYETTIALSDVQPTRAGYYFGGWCSVYTDGTSCTGTSYARGSDFGIDQTANDNTITLYAIWALCPINTICYDDNGAESPTKMNNQTLSATEITNSEFNLWASNFQRSGYGFIGWSEKANPTIGTDKIYGPMETINKSLAYGGMKVYAIWVPVVKDKDVNELTFQTTDLLNVQLTDTLGDTLASKSSGYIAALRDVRDNQVYAVAKLADGNYWMIENLRLNNNSTTPNWGDNSLSQGFGGVFSGLANAESENFSNSTTANSLYNTGDAFTMPRYNNNNTNSPIANMTGAIGNIYSYGNYYTWAAAIADTTAHSSSTDVINTSICPVGWHLPYGNSDNTSGGFYNLNYKINNDSNVVDATASKNLRVYPNNFVYSGFFNFSSASSRGSFGGYWSRTANGSNDAYYLNFDSSSVYPGTYDSSKYSGFSVRCVLGS